MKIIVCVPLSFIILLSVISQTLQSNPLKDPTMESMCKIVIVVCVIIIFTSVFCIKNSFEISISEKIKQYGMLKSVGATKKQIKKNVLFEGTILGTIGIPLGLLGGSIASVILLKITNELLSGSFANDYKLIHVFSYKALSIEFTYSLYSSIV